jgi:hypothetical protein
VTRHRFLDPEFRRRRVKIFVERGPWPIWRVVVVSGNGRILEVHRRFRERRARLCAFFVAEVWGVSVLEDRPRLRPTAKADRGRQLKLAAKL